jgi:hypothetical protein
MNKCTHKPMNVCIYAAFCHVSWPRPDRPRTGPTSPTRLVRTLIATMSYLSSARHRISHTRSHMYTLHTRLHISHPHEMASHVPRAHVTHGSNTAQAADTTHACTHYVHTHTTPCHARGRQAPHTSSQPPAGSHLSLT